MRKRYFLFLLISLALCSDAGVQATAQDPQDNQDSGRIQVNVNLVQLNVAVTDSKGRYIQGLSPQDFVITEDKLPQKMATFEEGNGPTRSLVDLPPGDSAPSTGTPLKRALGNPAASVQSYRSATDEQGPFPQLNGANVFILFDTSNYMYRGFAFAQDSIADFVRSLEGASKIAFYSYSRDLSRGATLTSDRGQVLRGVRSTVAGDDAALYNCLLLTVKDTAHYTGRKVIVVFSNGPDNASLVPPEDVAELAQSTGTVIYMISTQLAQDEPVSTAVFERMSASLHTDLLPNRKSQPRLAKDHGETRRQRPAEISHSHSRWISPATSPGIAGGSPSLRRGARAKVSASCLENWKTRSQV
jgi:VWFA-related protein